MDIAKYPENFEYFSTMKLNEFKHMKLYSTGEMLEITGFQRVGIEIQSGRVLIFFKKVSASNRWNAGSQSLQGVS
jgi:hypothetical protein